MNNISSESSNNADWDPSSENLKPKEDNQKPSNILNGGLDEDRPPHKIILDSKSSACNQNLIEHQYSNRTSQRSEDRVSNMIIEKMH